MKKLIMGLKDNRQVYVFIVIGLILIIFPNAMGIAAPYVLGGLMLIYGILNTVISIKYPESAVSLGDGVISIVIGGILLIQNQNSISILGIVWAMISLYEAAKEIDECRTGKKINLGSIIGIIGTVISIVLAVILMVNPFMHFYTHVRILGLEIIIYVILKGMDDWKTKRIKEKKQKEIDKGEN